MEQGQDDSPGVTVMPPAVVLLMMTAGLVLDWIAPAGFGFKIFGMIGFLMFCAGASAVAWSVMLFKKAGTNLPPSQPALAFVTDGPYKFSRNPIYTGGAIAFAGVALLSDAPAMLLLSVPLVYIIYKYVVLPEEAYLERKFGQDYGDYKNRVRRWF